MAIFAKGKESITKFFRELIDTIVEWFLRNKNKFEKADDFENLITKSNYRVFSKRYPKLIARGRSIVKKSFDKKFIKESKKFDTSTYRKEAKEAFEKYLAKSKPQTKISESTYLKFHKTLSLNKIAGEIAEELIIKYLKGKIEPRKSIRIPPDKRRFPDNFLSNTLKEVKSGRVTLKYKNQIDKDIKILSDKLKFNGQLIKKIEWHTMGGVDEAVLKYVKNEMQNNGLPLSKFQIIVY